ncbi:MAG TPA: TetR/AcrR family transcriptional regulator [Microbacteriaceae bacterium]|nr:TetR/AcrR family transcriptional regulator [Microbacteriaceae bacterium]
MAADRDVSYGARAIPVQQRGAERVDKLLDAAAAIIDEVGVAALTTSAVAERSGSSVGVVYRYFPNASVLVLALAERNRERFSAELAGRIEAGEAPDWQSYARTCVAAYATLARQEPGFATVRFGDVIAMRLNPKNANRNDELGLSLMQFLVTQFGFTPTPELEFTTTVAMETTDAMIRRAFQEDVDGDQRFIEAANSLIMQLLTPHAPAQ